MRLPPEAPPTLADTVEWQVRAILDRRLGLDSRAKTTLVVERTGEVADALASRLRTPPSSLTAVMPMYIELSTRQLSPGAGLTGSITAAPTSKGHMRGLRIQLVQERHHHGGLTESHVEPVVLLTGSCELQPGQHVHAPFRIDLPADARPCFEAEYCSQHLYLEIVDDLPLATDEVTRVELLVI